MRNRHKGESGFVFSLDGCLALVVIMIVVGGVASAGESELSYGQHGYLTLQRYANDALETMSLTGSMDNLADLLIKNNLNQAKTLVRQELSEVLPGEFQFKLVIGQVSLPDLVVYPSDATSWDNAFKNAKEIAVAERILSRHTTSHNILAWLDDPLDQAFMNAVLNGTNWNVTIDNTDKQFQSDILKAGSNGGLYYDVIFAPDDNTVTWSTKTIQNLLTYHASKGRLVFGGNTLYKNCYPINSLTQWELLENFGIGDVYPNGWGSVLAGPNSLRGTPVIVGQSQFDNMVIKNISIDVTLPPPFSVGYKVQYSGQTYEQYLYIPRQTGSIPTVAADWENVPLGWGINPTPWPAIIWWEVPPLEPTVLFNMRLAQSAMDNTTNPPNAGMADWVLLAKRAIGINVSDFKPATLYIWRGGAV